MKKTVLEFIRRGIVALGMGPLVLAVLYLLLRQQENLRMLTVEEVCLGIFSLSALAFIAGGMNVIYQVERLPLMVAISIHGGVLYICYLITYLVNNWLEWGAGPILVFTGIFAAGYLIIWALICFISHRNTKRVNEMLKIKQQCESTVSE